MKLKQSPEDFRVEELTDVVPASAGPFAFYRLEKRGWTTPDAIQAIRRRWRLGPRSLSYGGLKDRHAHTTQYLSVYHGPKRNLEHEGIQVRYLGQTIEPFTSSQIRANRFQVTLRAFDPKCRDRANQALKEIQGSGVPNYFDDQRFGSVSSDGRFIAQEMVLARWEAALKQALAAPYEFDRQEQKREKAILRENWGDWPECKKQLPRGHARSLVTYLADHPQDFRGAVARLRPELQGLYMSAYQSHVWNRAVALFLRRLVAAIDLVEIELKCGPLPFQRSPSPEVLATLVSAVAALPSARLKLATDDPWNALFQQVLETDGLTLDQMKLKGLQKPFFSRGDRPVLCMPRDLTWEFLNDEHHPGKSALKLTFELPRAAYATLIVKRIQAAVSSDQAIRDSKVMN
jgi:tRNA pseudouridine13 synthase